MANNLKQPFEDPPSSPSSTTGEKEIEFVSSQEDEEEEEENQHTIFSSDEDEPEDPPPRSSGEAQLSGRKRLSEGISTNVVSPKRAKKGKTKGTKKRVFSDKDEIVLLQGIIDSKGKINPLEDKRSLYESVKGSISFDVTLDQFKDKIRYMEKKYTVKEKNGEQASVLNPHEQKCYQLSKAIWGADGVAVESANGKSKKRVSKKRGKGKNAQEGSKLGDMNKSPLVEKESADWDENSFFLGMDFLKEKWTKVPTETKKETQEKMKKLHANELQCQKVEEMLKVMKDKCAHDKVELLNEVTSLIMAAD